VSSDESARLIKMEETLHNRVIGQEEAVVAISRAIRRARVGLKSPNRPIASFIFSGAPPLPFSILPFSLGRQLQTFCKETLKLGMFLPC
jgi:ATP-dependent Clp protease ATP-binding subunit ClpC